MATAEGLRVIIMMVKTTLTADKVIDLMAAHGEHAIIYAFNKYMTDFRNDSDSCIYYMRDFNDFAKNLCGYGIAERIYNGDFNPYMNFFIENAYGSFISYNGSGVAMHIARNIDDYYDVSYFLNAIKEYIMSHK